MIAVARSTLASAQVGATSNAASPVQPGSIHAVPEEAIASIHILQSAVAPLLVDFAPDPRSTNAAVLAFRPSRAVEELA
jgi:hypothetical protein